MRSNRFRLLRTLIGLTISLVAAFFLLHWRRVKNCVSIPGRQSSNTGTVRKLLPGAIPILMAAILAAVPAARAQGTLPYPLGTAFPMMLYEIGAVPSNVRTLANYGWNVFQNYGAPTTNVINPFLTVLATNGGFGDVVIPCNTDINTGVDYEWPEFQVQSWIQGLSANTNIAWWDLPEEMRPWKPTEMQLLSDYTAWSRLYDPGQRPTYEYTPNNRTASDIATIAQGVDILGISCYCEAMGMPHAWVRYKLQDVGVQGVAQAGAVLGQNYRSGQKTLVAALYCATNTSGNVATPQQCYHDVWSAIASGAQGIALFAYYHAVHDTPPLTNNLQQYNVAASQLMGPEQIGQVVLFGIPNTNVTAVVISGPANTVAFTPPGSTNISYPSLNVLCKIWSNRVYVIAVNSTSNTVSATISNLPIMNGTAILPFETNSVAITNRSISDTFQPWGVHVYKITPPPLEISSITVEGATVVLTFPAIANFSYVLQRSMGQGWASIGSNTASSTGLLSVTSNASASAAFYRLQLK
jgi:hypothetical protein